MKNISKPVTKKEIRSLVKDAVRQKEQGILSNDDLKVIAGTALLLEMDNYLKSHPLPDLPKI